MFSLPCLLTTRFLFALIRITINHGSDQGHDADHVGVDDGDDDGVSDDDDDDGVSDDDDDDGDDGDHAGVDDDDDGVGEVGNHDVPERRSLP